MQVQIQGRGINVRDELKEAIEKEMERLEKIFDRIVEVDVVLEGKLHQKEATVKVKVPEQTLLASEVADQFEISVEAAVDKLIIQLKKYKSKLRGR